MTYNDPVHEIACTFLAESEKAILINTHEENMWIPLSQVKEIHRSSNNEGTIVMTAWIAKKKGLI